MKTVLALTLILSASLTHALPDAKFKVRCRKVLHGTFQVEKFDNWQVVTNAMDSKLSGISIEKYDKLLPNAVPNDFKSKGKMGGSWTLKGGNYWLTCHHAEMKVVTVQKLADELKTCQASETADAVEVECF